MSELYRKPYEHGRLACINGIARGDNPVDTRSSANQRRLWDQGWLSVNKTNKCKGIKVAHQSYSGCLGLPDCPVCEGK